jgi:hypothetical protein
MCPTAVSDELVRLPAVTSKGGPTLLRRKGFRGKVPERFLHIRQCLSDALGGRVQLLLSQQELLPPPLPEVPLERRNTERRRSIIDRPERGNGGPRTAYAKGQVQTTELVDRKGTRGVHRTVTRSKHNDG